MRPRLLTLFSVLATVAATLASPRSASAQCPDFGPVGVSTPQSQTIAPGATATMSVSTPYPPSCVDFFWYQGTRGDTTSQLVSSGTGRSTYTTRPLTTTQNYWVFVGYVPFPTGNPSTASSNTGTITVLAPAHITTQPQSQSVGRGATATLFVEAIGPVPQTYQWYLGMTGDASSPIGGATGNSFITPALMSRTDYWVRVSNPFGPADSDTVTVTTVVSGDFDGDGKFDVLLRNTASGQTVGWLMNGSMVANSAFLPTIADTDWEATGVGDFDADGKADVIWRNRVSGQTIAWLMNGLAVSNAAFLPTMADTDWEIVGVGDVGGDLKADVIWRNKVSGENLVWRMNGSAMSSSTGLPTIADTNWQIVGVGDLDGDGKADVLWRNSVTGQDLGWLMNGSTVVSATFLPTIADTNWEIVGVSDVDADRKADVILRNKATGQDVLWLMNGLTVVNAAFLPTIADTNWEIKAIGDTNGDLKADVTLRNKVTGQNVQWLMNGLTVVNSQFLPTIADVNWKIVGQ